MKILKYGTIIFNEDGCNVALDDFHIDMEQGERMNPRKALDIIIHQLKQIQNDITLKEEQEMTHKIIQRVPAYFDNRDNEFKKGEFSNQEELESVDWIKNWMEPFRGYEFFRFSMADNTLMAEYDEGRHWWVIGFVDNLPVDFLPRWKPNNEQEAQDE